MKKFQALVYFIEGFVEEDLDTYDTYEETFESGEEYAEYLVSATNTGREVLHMSNPGDYDFDENNLYKYDDLISHVDVIEVEE